MKTDGTVKAEQIISDAIGGFSAHLDNSDRFGEQVISLAGLVGSTGRPLSLRNSNVQ